MFRDRLLARLESADRQRSGSESAQGLSDQQIGQLETYFNLLQKWNSRINLTALRLDPTNDHSMDRLFVEPLGAANYLREPGLRWADLGSGGGSPAVPLKIACPTAHLTMVESRGRKASFLRAVAMQLQFTGATVANVRAEALLRGFKETFDVITVRAVRLDEAFLSTVNQLLRPGGRAVLFVPSTAIVPVDHLSLALEAAIPAMNSHIRVLVKS